MRHATFESTNLVAAWHDGSDLILEFKGVKKYLYEDVPEEVFDALLVAESPGKFFHANIRGAFTCSSLQVEGEAA